MMRPEGLHLGEELVTATILASAVRRASRAGSRRASLLALGGVAVWPLAAQAGKSRKKAQKKCKRQESKCRAFYVDVCDTNQFCTDHSNRCCADFGRCDADAAIRCLALLV
jgi:hypothetical protein